MADRTNAALDLYLRKLQDLMVRDLPLLRLLESRGRFKPYTGGVNIKMPVGVHDHSTIVDLSAGTEEFPVDGDNISEMTSFDFARVGSSVIVTGLEMDQNGTGNQRLWDIYQERMKQTVEMLRRNLDQRITSGTNDTSAFSDMETFDGFGSTTGWFSPAAFGSQTNTIGGLAQASYTDTWQHQEDTAGGAFAANGLDAMARIMLNAASYGGRPSVILASPKSYVLYKSLLQAQERYIDAKELDAGVLALAYNSVPLLMSPWMGYNDGAGNDASMLFLDLDALTFYTGKSQGKGGTKGKLFTVRGPLESTTQDATITKLIFHGQLVIDRLATSGVLINAEA